jgi:hypothetical protein
VHGRKNVVALRSKSRDGAVSLIKPLYKDMVFGCEEPDRTSIAVKLRCHRSRVAIFHTIRPIIIVMSDFNAFQNFASISCGLGMDNLLS